jgi:CheY-like chemotaxis protein
MADMGRILIADDEETFLFSTADLLRREGYECDCAPDAETSVEMLRNVRYDLLIADIKMPGNSQLEFISELPSIVEGLPVILVTGYPSINSAIQSLQLPVVAYMPKPVDFDQLLSHVQNAITQSRISHAVYYLQQRLQESHEGLTDIRNISVSAPGHASLPVDAFLELTFHNIIGALADLMHVTESFAKQEARSEICHLLNCPKLIELTNALEDTIDVLEKTKNSFKSKELGELRQKLERIVKNKIGMEKISL